MNIYNISPVRARRRACDINIMIRPNSHDMIITILIRCLRVVPIYAYYMHIIAVLRV